MPSMEWQIIIILFMVLIRSFSGFLFFIFLMALSGKTKAQDLCESMTLFEEGTQLEYSHYDKKGKFTGSQRMKVYEVSESNGRISSTMDLELKNKKGEVDYVSQLSFSCENNTFYVDLKNYLDPEIYKSLGEMELSIEGDQAIFPGNMTVGMNLDDCKMNIDAGTNGMKFMSIQMEIKNRKVEAFETINTEAGTFDCYKISYDTHLKAIIKREFKSVVWFSKKVGTVKTETYNKKDKLESSTLLTQLTQ